MKDRDPETSGSGNVPLYATTYLADMNATRAAPAIEDWLAFLENQKPYGDEMRSMMVKKGKEDLPFIIALETDDADTESARESGEIGKDERIYSIDQYYKDGSEGVFTMYKSKPDYAEVKKIVTDAIGHSAEPAATLEGK